MTDIVDPVVTVYLTCYNYESYVEQAIESVLAQSMQNFELIIIDDGSTDGSRDKIQTYELHPKVRVVFQSNKGLNRTANIALNLARGKYIMRLDADDYLDPQALLVMSNALENDPKLGLVFPDYYYVDAQSKVSGQERRHDFSKDVSLLDQPAHGACTMIRRAYLLGIDGYTEDYRCQDGYDLWLRFTEKYKVLNVNLPLFYYRRHGSNLTTQNKLILETRARIKKDHATRTNKASLIALGIITVRGRGIDPGCLALEALGSKRLIDWTIDAALAAAGVDHLVLSTPDDAVIDHVSERYNGRVQIHRRKTEHAREGVSLKQSIDDIINADQFGNAFDAILFLSDETPYRSAEQISEAIDTMRLFDVDSVIPIIPENDLIYRHNGSGLEAVGHASETQGLRLERNHLYRKVRGLTLTSRAFFNDTSEAVGGSVGHITYDQRSAFTVQTALDLQLARTLLEQAA